MNNVNVDFIKCRDGAKVPLYNTEDAAGADLHVCIDEDVLVKSGETYFAPTGIKIAIPRGYVGLIFARSGLACKKGLAPANKVGVIDSDYRGEIFVALYNHSSEDIVVEPGERIAQLMIIPYLFANFNEVEELDDTIRGEKGFGSSGK